MAVVIDIIVAVILFLPALRGFMKGLFKAFSGLITFIIAIFTAYFLKSPVADFLYDKLLLGSISNGIETNLAKIATQNNFTIGDLVKSNNVDYLELLKRYSVSRTDIMQYSDKISADSGDMLADVSNKIASPVARNIASVLAALIIFILTIVILNIVLHYIGKLGKAVGLGFANKIFGGLIGLVIGVILASAFVTLFKSVLPVLSSAKPELFNIQLIEQTKLALLIDKINIFGYISDFIKI